MNLSVSDQENDGSPHLNLCPKLLPIFMHVSAGAKGSRSTIVIINFQL